MKGNGNLIALVVNHAQAEIKQLIMERFDIFASNNGVQTPEETAATNGHTHADNAATVPSPTHSSSPVKRQVNSEEASEPASASPPPKKRKPDTDVDADALFAAKLQAEENMRARPTRGASTRRAAPAKKKSKAKTAKRVKAEDDSDVETGMDTKKEVNRSSGFHVCPYRRDDPASWISNNALRSLSISHPHCLRCSARLRYVRSEVCYYSSTNPPTSFRVHRRSRRYGSTSVKMSFKTLVIDAKFAATMRCALSLSRIGSTCSP